MKYKKIANGMVNIIKPLEISSFKSIYPNMFTSISVRGIHLISKSYFSIIGKTTMASCLEVRKKKLPVYDFHLWDFSDCYPYNDSTRMFEDYIAYHISYTTKGWPKIYRYMYLINKILKCASFSNIFANLARIFVTFP